MESNTQGVEPSASKPVLPSREGLTACQGTVELKPLLRQIILQQLDAMAKNKVRLSHGDSGILPLVRGNSADLHHLLTSLISHAIEAVPQGGLLAISTTHFAQDGTPERVEVRVEHTGPGNTGEDSPKVLPIYFQTKPKSNEAYLETVRVLLSSSGGSIRVEGQPGSGVTFIVTLPVFLSKESGVV